MVHLWIIKECVSNKEQPEQQRQQYGPGVRNTRLIIMPVLYMLSGRISVTFFDKFIHIIPVPIGIPVPPSSPRWDTSRMSTMAGCVNCEHGMRTRCGGDQLWVNPIYKFNIENSFKPIRYSRNWAIKLKTDSLGRNLAAILFMSGVCQLNNLLFIDKSINMVESEDRGGAAAAADALE